VRVGCERDLAEDYLRPFEVAERKGSGQQSQL
jgi:hypothetical protein